MRLPYIIALSLLFLFVNVQAQYKYFEKKLNFGGHIHQGEVIKVIDGQNLILNGDLISWDTLKWYPYLAKLNLYGDTIWSHAYKPIAGEQVGNNLILIDEGFAITGLQCSHLR